jgi:hypothetical protein
MPVFMTRVSTPIRAGTASVSPRSLAAVRPSTTTRTLPFYIPILWDHTHISLLVTRLQAHANPILSSLERLDEAVLRAGRMDLPFENATHAEVRYSIFDSGVYRIHAAKWLFPQEKPPSMHS